VGREDDRGSARLASAGFEIRIPARIEELRRLRHALTRWLEGQGTPSDVGADVALATHEAAANAVEHAYPREPGDLVVRAGHDDGVLVVIIADEGRWRPPSRTDQRGRGLTLMHNLMDSVQIDPSPSGTRVTLRREVHAAG
jgi:anti-sigma regulatory factor (Ser/Thr protein kinase)